MTRKKLKARDIERLENTSSAGVGAGILPASPVQGEPLGITPSCPTLNETCGCQICLLETDCCGVTTSTPTCDCPTAHILTLEAAEHDVR